MKIRAAVREDIPVIVEMSELYVYSPFIFDTQMARYATRKPVFVTKMLEIPGSVLLVLDDSGSVKGYILLTLNEAMSEMTGLKIANILLLALKPEIRGKGYARKLIEKGLDVLRHLGTDLISVGTDLYNNAAISIYESCGFRLRMGWHIFRIFQDDPLEEPKNVEIDDCDRTGLDAYYRSFHRAISFFYERKIDKEKITQAIFNQFKKNVIEGRSIAMESEDSMLVVSTRDELSEQTFGIERVYRLSDVLYKNGKFDERQASNLIKTALIRLKPWNYVEAWIDASDQKRIRLFENAGFHLSYTGVSLHKLMT